jgi:hypothetical protein
MVGQLVANLGSMLKGLENVMVWKHQSKPEQNIKANQSRHTGQTELQPTPVKTVQYKQSR